MVALRHGKVFQKKILRIEGSVSCEWDEPIFRLSTIVFADGTRASCEGFISKLSKDLTGTHWPCGIDGMAYQLAWAPKFAEGAAKAGYALDDGWLSRFTEA